MMKYLQPLVRAGVLAFWDVAGNVHELAFLVAGRTNFRWHIAGERIPALGAFPF
jgi:hypothetical protein